MFYTNYERYCQMIGKSTYAVAEAIGVKSTNTIAGWKDGATPRPKMVDKIVKYFRENGLQIEVADLFSESENISGKDEKDAMEVREMLRSRPEARVLFSAAKNAPASAFYEAAALLLRYQEEKDNR